MILNELQNCNYFFVRHKNKQKQNQHFELQLFMINLHSDT